MNTVYENEVINVYGEDGEVIKTYEINDARDYDDAVLDGVIIVEEGDVFTYYLNTSNECDYVPKFSDIFIDSDEIKGYVNTNFPYLNEVGVKQICLDIEYHMEEKRNDSIKEISDFLLGVGAFEYKHYYDTDEDYQKYLKNFSN